MRFDQYSLTKLARRRPNAQSKLMNQACLKEAKCPIETYEPSLLEGGQCPIEACEPSLLEGGQRPNRSL